MPIIPWVKRIIPEKKEIVIRILDDPIAAKSLNFA